VESEMRGSCVLSGAYAPATEDNFSLNKSSIITNQLDRFVWNSCISRAGLLSVVFSVLVGGFGCQHHVCIGKRTYQYYRHPKITWCKKLFYTAAVSNRINDIVPHRRFMGIGLVYLVTFGVKQLRMWQMLY
jgi:putative ABC transport system permease protein